MSQKVIHTHQPLPTSRPRSPPHHSLLTHNTHNTQTHSSRVRTVVNCSLLIVCLVNGRIVRKEEKREILAAEPSKPTKTPIHTHRGTENLPPPPPSTCPIPQDHLPSVAEVSSSSRSSSQDSSASSSCVVGKGEERSTDM